MSSTFLNDLLRTISTRGRKLLGQKFEKSDANKDLISRAQGVLANKGEASGVALAEHFFSLFHKATDAEKKLFFTGLVHSFGPDKIILDQAITAYQTTPTPAHALALHTASESKRQDLFRRLNLAPGGTVELVNMRANLLTLLKDQPDLKLVDSDLAHLFSSWFNRGFLVIKKIDWNTSATILEKIIHYEAVHEIHNWDELRRRIDPADRHCYAFFHPALLDEPLIFVEVALTNKISGAIAPILSSERNITPSDEIDTAIFYSISNCQKGLKGISFGHFLIKQVVEELKQDHPSLKTFSTLSPVPNFMRWFKSAKAHESSTLYEDLQDDDWWESPERAQSLKEKLMPAMATYLAKVKSNGFPLDPVARFHLGNGASLERINWLSDTSKKGMSQSLGMMVNYLYNIDKIQENHERYAASGEITLSSSVQKLLKS